MVGAEPVVSSMWAFVTSWSTPTVLFCVLNLMIGTIYITSNFKTQYKHNHHQNQKQLGGVDSPQLGRVPSLLDRVRSFDFSLYRTDNHQQVQPQFGERDSTQLGRVPSLLDRVRSFDFSSYTTHHQQQVEPQFGERDSPQLGRVPSLLDRVRSFGFSRNRPDPPQPDTQHADQTHQDQNPGHGPDHHVTRSKSDTSGKSPAESPAKVRKSASEKSVVDASFEEEEEGSGTASFKEDDAVDAKADDFINRFRQQLKMQRLDSLQRFKDMLRRGTGP